MAAARSTPVRILLLAGAALAGAVTVLVLTGPDRLPPLEPETLESARARWQAAAVPSYDLELDMEGSELTRAAYRVEVRDGVVVRLLRDGAVSGGDPTFYSVDGLFRLIDQEVELSRDPSRGLGAPAGYRAYLSARFDDHNGLPLRFRRVVGGTSHSSEWRVRSFTPR